ncbi:MAG: hypothetical protein ACREBW_06905 [Candidatus Micrarchaeaceae archaeon]
MIRYMEDYSFHPYQPESPEVRILRLLNICIAAGGILCAFFIFLAVAGFGSAAITGMPADTVISINGHRITAGSLKMRPGSYQVTVTSPTISPYQGTLHISLFATTQFKPTLKPRDANSVVSSTLGAVPNSMLVPKFGTVKYFPDNWIAGALSPDGTVIALHYDESKKQWAIGYCGAPGYPQDTASIPNAVGTYIQSLIAARNDA